MEREPPRAVVVLVLTPWSDARRTAEVAAGVAAAEGARLRLVFLRDSRLPRAAALPFTRSTGLFSGGQIAFDESAAERSLHVAEQEAKAQVESVAAAAGISLESQHIDAPGAGWGVKSRADADVVVIGSSGHVVAMSGVRPRRLSGRGAHGPVAVYLERGESAEMAKRLIRLARGQHSPLLIVSADACRMADAPYAVIRIDPEKDIGRSLAEILCGHECAMLCAARHDDSYNHRLEALAEALGIPLVLTRMRSELTW